MDSSDQQKAGLGSVGGGILMGVGAFFTTHSFLRGILCALAIILLLVALYILWSIYRSKKKEQKTGQQVGQVLEKTIEGFDAIKAAGCEVDKIPWYMIAGEAASGKSVACGKFAEILGMPEEFKNPRKGMGGTVGMDWWPCRSALFLDLAGEFFFNDTTEWRQFLKTLFRIKPHNPITGMFLFIPANQLVGEDDDQTAQKASRIRAQLKSVQEGLGVLFPVYVIISKSDLIPGFRQYFRVLNSDGQQKIFGWSKPGLALDGGFSTRQVMEGLKELTRSAKARCLTLLNFKWQGYTPEEKSKMLMAAYEFPTAFDEMLPRLETYLKSIFSGDSGEQSGYWKGKAARPTQFFVRGVYFTSSNQQGLPVLQDLARELGKDVKDLESEQQEKEYKVFFLKDLVEKKVSAEPGLVTTVPDYLRQRRLWHWITVSSSVATLLLFGGLVWWGASVFNKSVGGDVGYWKTASRTSVENNSPDWWKKDVDGKNLVEWHYQLAQAVQKPVHIPWIFGILPDSIQKKRKEAQTKKFESQLLFPIIQQTRSRMLEGKLKQDELQQGILGLAALEADGATKSGRPDFVLANCWPLFDKQPDLLKKVISSANLTYNSSQTPWPPPSLLDGSTRLSGSRALSTGLDSWKSELQQKTIAAQGAKGSFNTYLNALAAFLRLESDERNNPDLLARLQEAAKKIDTARDEFEKDAEKVSKGIVSSDLAAAWNVLELKQRSVGTTAIDALKKALTPYSTTQIGKDLAAALDTAATEIATVVQGQKSPELDNLNASMLGTNSTPFYKARLQNYEKIAGLNANFEVGGQWAGYRDFLSRRQQMRKECESYSGGAVQFYKAVLAALDRNLDVKVASTLDTEYIPKVKQLCEKMNQTTFSGNLSVISTNLNSCLSNFTLVKRDLELTNDWPRSAQESLMALSKTTASLEQTFGERVAFAINSYFQGVLRFPLVKEAPNAPMSLADLRRFTNEVTQSTGWLGQVASRHPRVASAASFQQLQSGLSSLLTLANILQTPTNRAVFTISNLRSRDFQSIKLRGATGGADGEPLRNGADHLLGNIALYDKPIFEFDNAPLSINAEWGAIQYYLEAQNRIFKMKPTGSTSPIDIMVTVPDGLPAPSKWPAKDDFASWHW